MLQGLEEVNTPFDRMVNQVHRMSFLASQEQNKTYTFKYIMNHDDRGAFVWARMKEMENHESRDYWMLVPRSQMPSDTKNILSIWF